MQIFQTNSSTRGGKEIAFVMVAAATAYLPVADAGGSVQSLPEGHKRRITRMGRTETHRKCAAERQPQWLRYSESGKLQLIHQLHTMHSTKTKYINYLLDTENGHLKKLNEIVLQSIEQEKLLLQNISEAKDEKLSIGQRLADRVARFGGSWKFISWFAIVLCIWIGINLIFTGRNQFDPYPFILLNLLLSCLAAIQAPVIMMSQNRQEEKDRKRNENDYVVNLKAEIEIRTLHQKVDLLMQEQFKQLIESQAEQIRLLQSIIRESKHNTNNNKQ
jgi:uncharacterized membrane protein